MIQKRNISTFAIGLCLLALMLLSASPAKAKYKVTHTPGETVGPAAYSPIKYGQVRCATCGYVEFAGVKRRLCEENLAKQAEFTHIYSACSIFEPHDVCFDAIRSLVGMRYLQIAGGAGKKYCYYYKGGTSSGASGPNTWRYDPS